MAVPDNPTITQIKTDAYKKAGVDSASSTETTRADRLLQEVLNEIWMASFRDGNTRLKSLEAEAMDISTKGLRAITLPEDFDEEISVIIMDGTHRGTAQTGSSTSITFASNEDATETDVVGKTIVITGGTGVDSYGVCTAYNTSTKVATVSSWSSTSPSASSTYLIANKPRFLEEENIREFDEDNVAPSLGIPSAYAKFNRQIVFDRPFDLSTYGIYLKYFMHVHQVDLTEGNATRITRILRDWRFVLTNGLAYKIMELEDNDKYIPTKKLFDDGIQTLLVRHIPYGGELTRLRL